MRINEYNVDEHAAEDDDTLCRRLKKFNSQRFLQFWHDGSSISNHAHLLIVVNILYDPAIFLTNEEYHEKHGKIMNVQSEVEKPFTYIIARCPADDHQLMYADTRIDDIRELKSPVTYGKYELTDVARFFHGDGPACALEAGQQKNGRYPCWVCPADVNNKGPDIAHIHYLPCLTLKDRTNKVLSTVSSENKIKSGRTKLYKNLKKQEIIELHERGFHFIL